MCKSLFSLLAGGLFLVGCTSTRNINSSPENTDNIGVVSCGQAGSLVWERFTGTRLPAVATMPKKYTLYKVSGAASFFRDAKTEAAEVAIPMTAGCISFKVVPSGTMSEGLQEKYPQLVSLKGSNGAGDDLRLDWNGTAFNGQVISAGGGKTFLLTPYPGAKGAVYMVYEKSDAGTQKQPFEINRTTPVSPAGMQRTTAPPVEK